jgi:hypothetical protein
MGETRVKARIHGPKGYEDVNRSRTREPRSR